MGRIQNSINQLIFTSSLIANLGERKHKESVKEKKKDQKLKSASQKAIEKANEEIAAKYLQSINFKDRHNQALMKRMNLTEPHKPLPSKEE